jgi:hypothetical protein
MLAKVLTCAVVGLEGAMVEVEVDIGPWLPAFNMVGLPDAAVQEAKERIPAAVKSAGCVFPMRRITVNFAPADLKKEGSASPTGHPDRLGNGRAGRRESDTAKGRQLRLQAGVYSSPRRARASRRSVLSKPSVSWAWTPARSGCLIGYSARRMTQNVVAIPSFWMPLEVCQRCSARGLLALDHG